MKQMNRIWVLLLSLALFLTGLQITPATEAAAKKKMKLSQKKLTLKVGQKKKLKVKNKKGKVKWKSSKKKVATVSKKGVVKAKKVGKAKITATVKKKKLTCKVTVKKKDKKPKKTPAPTPKKTPTKTPAKTPGNTKTPSQIDTAKAVEWNIEKQGAFAVSGISFPDKSLTYQLPDEQDVVLVNTGNKPSVKEAVADLKKCTFEVYAAGKNYTDTAVGDIKWNSKSYHPNNRGNGYYTYKLYVAVSGKTYYRTCTMAETIKTVNDDGRNFSITAIQSGGQKLSPSRDRGDAWHYMLELTNGATSVKALIPDLAKAEITAAYMGKKVTVERIKDIEWKSGSYYEDYQEGTGYYSFTVVARNGAQQIEVPLVLSDFNENLEVAEYTYVAGGQNKKGVVNGYTREISLAVENGKTIKEILPDMSSFTFSCYYHGRLYQNVKATEVQWKAEPYYENECDKGYYTFKLAITAENGKQIKEDFWLIEEFRVVSVPVSGTLKSAAGELVEGEILTFKNRDTEYNYTVTTKAGGAYSIDLPAGEYEILWNKYTVDTVTVGKEPLTYNIESERMVKVSGTVTRRGKAWTDCDIEFMDQEDGDFTIIVHSDAATGAYSVYLPKDNHFYAFIDDFTIQYTFGADGSDSNVTRDISSDYVKISGTIYQTGTTPFATGFFNMDLERWSEGDKEFRTDENGKYVLYANVGDKVTIKHMDSQSIIGEVTLGEQDVVKDMTVGVTHITGTLTALNGDVLPGYYIYYDTGNNQKGFAETDEDGGYSVYLKPGVYTVTVRETELSQKITVGAISAVCNLQAPLYKVSGTVKNGAESLVCDKQINLAYGDEEDYLYFYTGEDGEFCEYLPARTYMAYLDGYSKESGVELKVERDLARDIVFGYTEVKGHIYRTAGKEFEADSNILLSIADPDGEEMDYWLFPGEDPEYSLYLEKKGTYSVTYWLGNSEKTLDTFEVSESGIVTHDIVCNLYKVEGNVTGLRDGQEKYLSFEAANVDILENGETIGVTSAGEVQNEKMPYYIYLPAGVYNAYIPEGENPEKHSVQITGDTTGVDIAASATYKVSGTLSRPSGGWGGQVIAFDPAIMGDGYDGYKETTSKADGSYEVFLKPGTYAVFVNGDGMADDDGNQVFVTVADTDITKDISMVAIQVSGTLQRKGELLKGVEISFLDAEGTGKYVRTNENGEYRVTLPPSSTYTVCMNGVEIDTIAAGETDIADKVLSVNAVKVSGKFKNTDGEEIPWGDLYFYKQGVDIPTYTNADDMGDYFVWLLPGTYNVKYNDETVLENLVVGTDDIERDIVLES